MSDLEHVLSRLSGVRRSGNGWVACCPSHEDRTPSLSIRQGSNGRVLFKCFAGCRFEDIRRGLNMTTQELGPDKSPAPHESTCDFQDLVARLCRNKGGVYGGQWTYRDDAGREVFRVLRIDLPGDRKTCVPLRPEGQGWIARKPRLRQGLPLYRANDIHPSSPVYVVEGERCADVLWDIGLAAVTSAGGARAASQSNWEKLAGRNVVILPDQDNPGANYAADVASILRTLSPPACVKVVNLKAPAGETPTGFDVVDWLDALDSKDGDAQRIELERLVNQPPDLAALLGGMTLDDLARTHPEPRPPVIDGLLRRGQVGFIVGSSKSNKTWATMQLALDAVSGALWLNKFPTMVQRVLYIDAELQPDDAGQRFRALGGSGSSIVLKCMRGQPGGIDVVERLLGTVPVRAFDLVILDPLYMLYPETHDENSNAAATHLVRRVQSIAERLDAAVLIVHHTSKGNQSEKSTVDVGAGAGAYSRAADAWLTLRQHEQPDTAVFDAVVRSFPPIAPFCIKREHPLWILDQNADPALLRGAKRKKAADKLLTWTNQSFTEAFAQPEWEPKATITERALAGREGYKLPSKREVDSLLKSAVAARNIEEESRAKGAKYYRRAA